MRLHGFSAAATLEEMSAVLQRMAVMQAVPDMAVSGEDPDLAVIGRLAQAMPADETQLLYSICLHGRAELGLAPDEYAGLTMVLLRLLAFKPTDGLTSASTSTSEHAGAEKKSLKLPVDALVQAAAPVAAVTRAAPAVLPAVAVLPSVPISAEGAPPGQFLRVVDPPVAKAPTRSLAPGQAASPVLGVPVRVQSESALDISAGNRTASRLVLTEEGDFWHATVTAMAAAESITALVRELALQSQLVARDDGHWMLRVERESLNQPVSRERLTTALAALGHVVSLSVEVGSISDSPARRNAAAAAERQATAEALILGDTFVQTMMRDFGAKIVPGSIKPVLNN